MAVIHSPVHIIILILVASLVHANKEADVSDYFHFFTGGIPAILWRDLRPNLDRGPLFHELSPSCRSSLISVSDGLDRGSLFAYQFIDASGKAPAGLLDGTMVSLGDFDLCLQTREPTAAQYCLLELTVKDLSNSSIATQEVHHGMKQVSPLLNFFRPRIGVCVPEFCSEWEVVRLVQHRMTSHPVSVTDTISCQTINQLNHRIKDMSGPQLASLIALIFLLGLSFISFVADRFGLRTNGLLSSFSPKKNIADLFRHQSGRNMTVDYMKLGFSLTFVSMHAIGGADNPYSPLMLARMKQALSDTNRLELQAFFSDTLGEIMFLMSGYVTVFSLFSSLGSGISSPFRHMLLKWSKLLPLILSLMALEFVWPLLGSGPFYPEVSNFVHTNCRKYWLANVLLVANYFPSLEKCTPQLFYSSVDFQLCIFAIPAVLILKRNARSGIAFVALLIVSSLALTIYIARRFNVIPNYVSRDADVLQRMDFMDYIHLPANTHAPAYFIGFLIGYKSITGTRIVVSQRLRVFLSYVCYVCTFLAVLGPALYNTFQILPMSLVPYYIVAQKLMYIMVLLPVLLRSASEKVTDKESGVGRHQRQNDDNRTEDYSVMAGICRLTFAIYLINYYCIRYDFLTSRILFEPGLFHATKRFIFCVFLTLIASFVFQILVASPLENLRRKYFCPLIQSSPTSDHTSDRKSR